MLLSARRVGQAGRVYGLDASPEMISLARANAAAAAAGNVEAAGMALRCRPPPAASTCQAASCS